MTVAWQRARVTKSMLVTIGKVVPRGLEATDLAVICRTYNQLSNETAGIGPLELVGFRYIFNWFGWKAYTQILRSFWDQFIIVLRSCWDHVFADWEG